MGKFYTFSKSRSGEIVPALVLPSGETRPLHSMIDPQREAQRLISEGDTGFVVFLGLGGGFAPKALLDQTEANALVIEFNKDGIKELFSEIDYSKLLENERFSLLIDPSNEEIKNFIIENYKPSLCGGIKTIPLRTRTEENHLLFDDAVRAIQEAVEIVSMDYSVQAHFGKRWFSNIIRNILNIESENSICKKIPSSIQEAAIVAAGPSLDQQIPALKECKSRQVFIISCDTALPALLHYGIEPDAAVSIDCQHISFCHFLCCGRRNLPNITLILDIASPPLLSSFSLSPLFFSSDHPLAQYISLYWKPFPKLDTSGGNVTYAALSLAENLGAKRVTLFGADSSYVNSRTYARGTYIYPYFEKRQNRFSPLEAQSSSFLYRSPFLPKMSQTQSYRETSSLRFYREKLEEKAVKMTAQISCAQGQGAPVNLTQKKANNKINEVVFNINLDKPNISGIDFLKQYREEIASLPEAGNANYIGKLDIKNRQIFNTILPTAAAIKRTNPHLKLKDLIEDTKQYCVNQITNVLRD
jgi:hypothetical protein